MDQVSGIPKLPKYRSHKIVGALKIKQIAYQEAQTEGTPAKGRAILSFFEEGYPPLEMEAYYIEKHQPRVGGYLVVYGDGYQSWSPADMFEAGNTLLTGRFNFGVALELLKDGKCVAREGWNGKGMYLWLMPATTVKAEWCHEPHLKALAEANGGEIEALGTIRMMTADKKVLTGWLASQTDMLAVDWVVVWP